jgi:protein-tyrosine kinase
MSRNFELLRRAGKDEALFHPAMGDAAVDNPATHADPETTRPVVVGFDKVVTPWRAPQWGAQEQEELVKLVRRVFAFPNSHSPRAVTFSGVEGNGSTEMCWRTGQVLALLRRTSVCLVDANLRAPLLHLLPRVAESPGLADAAVRPGPIKDFALRIGGNLWIVPPGSRSSGAQALFASDRLSSRISELRAAFDYVLIDTPPLSSYADAILFGRMAEGTILVVEANSTRREVARMAKEALEGGKVKLLGAVLNNRTFPIPEAVYRRFLRTGNGVSGS